MKMRFKKQFLAMFLAVIISSAAFANNGLLPLSISGENSTFGQSSPITTTIPVVSGWNIVSVPVNAADMTIASIFPTAATSAFGFNNGYFVVTTAQNGKGYFIRFNNAGNISVTGNLVTPRTISVVEGWNMIGPFESNVTTSQITSTPPGIVATQYFGFNNGYVTATTLEKGKGYWVRVSQAGVLNIP